MSKENSKKICQDNPISEFEQIVDTIVGVYIDATSGFKIYQSRLKEIVEIKNASPNQTLFYGRNDPNEKPFKPDHTTSISAVKLRNTETGSNFQFIGNMCLVSIYQYWEDYYRIRIKKLLGKEKLETTIMGEIKSFRQSIIHRRGIAKAEVKNFTLLKWYQEGDEIFINEEQFYKIVEHIHSYIEELKKEFVLNILKTGRTDGLTSSRETIPDEN